MNQKQHRYNWIYLTLIVLAVLAFLAACGGGSTEAADPGQTTFVVNPTSESVEADFTAICGEKTDLDPAENSVKPGVLCTFSNKSDVSFSVAEVVSNVPGAGVLGEITPTEMELPIYGVTMTQVEDSFLRLERDTTKVCVDFSITGVSVAYACPFLDVSP